MNLRFLTIQGLGKENLSNCHWRNVARILFKTDIDYAAEREDYFKKETNLTKIGS